MQVGGQVGPRRGLWVIHQESETKFTADVAPRELAAKSVLNPTRSLGNTRIPHPVGPLQGSTGTVNGLRAGGRGQWTRLAHEGSLMSGLWSTERA
jgi:hypothetical protein